MTMNMTKKRETQKLLTVDVDGLAAMLSCGRATARKIGEDAGARQSAPTGIGCVGKKGWL
jgi:hypothetical protein